MEVRSPNADFEEIFRAATKDQINALITARNSVLIVTEIELANSPLKSGRHQCAT